MQAAVTHQLITVTDTYNFHNDAKSSADALLLCSTNEYAATQAFQEVRAKLNCCSLCTDTIVEASNTVVLQITVGDDDDAPVLQVSKFTDVLGNKRQVKAQPGSAAVALSKSCTTATLTLFMRRFTLARTCHDES